MIDIALLVAGAVTVSCWLLHVAVWRILRPNRSIILWLSSLFFVFPYSCVAVLWACFPAEVGAFRQALGAAAILHGAASICYIFQYTGIAQFSPSVEILRFVRLRMPEGVSVEEIDAPTLTDEVLIGERISHLAASPLVQEDHGALHLTRMGRFFVQAISLYRSTLFLPKVGRG